MKTPVKYGATAAAVVVGALFFSGCGESDGGKQFSQEFEKPEGAPAAKADPNAGLSRSELRHKDIEESKREPVGKGKGRR